MIEFCRTTEEFIEKYSQDVINIIEGKYKNAIKFDRDSLEIAQSFFCHALRARFVEKFINDHPAKAKFSSYCYMCLHNYLCAFEIQETKRKEDFYKKTCSLDEALNEDESFTRYCITEAPEEESSFDLELIYDKLNEYDKKSGLKLDSSKKLTSSKIPLAFLFREYLLDEKDSSIAKKVGVTCSAVGARKKILREQIREFFYTDF